MDHIDAFFLINRQQEKLKNLQQMRWAYFCIQSRFRYDVKGFDYDIQAYIYTKVSGKEVYWLAQGKSKPYLCSVYKASDAILKSGEEKFWSAVDNIKRWLDEPSKDTSSFALYGVI